MFFSVIMPTYNQASFIKRAINSLKSQTFKNWELIIINDGSTDETEDYASSFLKDTRVTYIKNIENKGLGAALNQGLALAKHEYVAYLPSDDYYYEEHLENFAKKFSSDPNIFLVFSGMAMESKDTMSFSPDKETKTIRENYSLQLVQTAHRKTNHKWVERNEWVTENLFLMYWRKLLGNGVFYSTQEITCFWTNHPWQRHKIVGENYGGSINLYRSFYKVKSPIKLRVSSYKFINEDELYSMYRGKLKPSENCLKILIVGELSYNPERIVALEESGHKLYGLWVNRPRFCFNYVGHLPFGNIEDVPYDNWQEKIEEIKPDIIYALLNFDAVPLAYEVLKKCAHLPFVWHFKEGPTLCLSHGTWNKLIYLFSCSDGNIFLNRIIKAWYEQFANMNQPSFIMDGDLPKDNFFTGDFSKKISLKDGAIHTIIAGRMVGLTIADLIELKNKNIHIHLYTENYYNSRENEIKMFIKAAPKHFHIHPHCSHLNWVKEFSKYDAGWLHSFKSQNEGNIMRASWDDLNIPARINTYMAAGIPVILKNNEKHIVATEYRIRELEIGILFNDINDLSEKLRNKELIKELSLNVHKHRMLFTFDHYVPELITFFRTVIEQKKRKQ